MSYKNESTIFTESHKEATSILCIGTFLEYFDLMLYIHMAVLLNELFFPKAGPYTDKLLAAFGFCSTYLLRPFGAVLFGWIGDNIGRKACVIITTILMAFSCIVIAVMPTYAEIGITASVLITFCRIFQGLSSMGEMIGAAVYLTETIPHPYKYPSVASLSISISIGSTCALGVATLATSYGFNWRYAFLAGAMIAMVGSVARNRLRETPDFIDAKRALNKCIEKADIKPQDMLKVKDIVNENPVFKEKINYKNVMACFALTSTWPVWFYITYIYSTGILKGFGMSAHYIVTHNFMVSVVALINAIVLTILSRRINPLQILKYRAVAFCIYAIFLPFIICGFKNSMHIFLFQIAIIVIGPTMFPALPIVYKYFPVLKRYTLVSLVYSISRLFIYLITSFGLVMITEAIGNIGILIIIVPVLVCFMFARNYYEKLESSNYHEASLSKG